MEGKTINLDKYFKVKKAWIIDEEEIKKQHEMVKKNIHIMFIKEKIEYYKEELKKAQTDNFQM